MRIVSRLEVNRQEKGSGVGRELNSNGDAFTLRVLRPRVGTHFQCSGQSETP